MCRDRERFSLRRGKRVHHAVYSIILCMIAALCLTIQCMPVCGTCRPTHRERYGTGLPWATAWPAGITAHSSLRGTPCALTLRGGLSDKPTPLPVSYAIYMRCVFLQGGALFLRAAWAGRCSATPHLARTVSERASERATPCTVQGASEHFQTSLVPYRERASVTVS